ncbi:protein of unknown function [Singulisphaera sp. GP187]|uniref:DUF4394 domain-containing protein n=1 Tax=Singulisphaera sp. GP187 TaxID=1882752 RepID=UPI00092C2D8C|nr:DUF4394 domain-containing protein [Singulisphaera sp. GP187]SIO56059.1 protein of unknown function [Singulisphaera sp. GP187]
MAPMSIAVRKFGSRHANRSQKPVRRQRTIGILEQCENRTLLTTAFGVTTASVLIQFDPATASVVSAKQITNIGAGETIQGIDFRPATRQLYALTTDANQTGRLYTINTTSAIAGLESTINVPVTGTHFGLDFNPVSDRLRVVSDSDLNLRIDVATGNATTDGTLAYNAGDPSAGQDPNVVGSAYTNNFTGTTVTTLYQIDLNLDIVAIQSPPNDGTLATVGGLGVDATSVVGFDVLTTGEKASPTNQAIAALQVGGTTGLYTVNLTTGAATLIGPYSDVMVGELIGFAIEPANQAMVNSPNAFGIDATNNNLIRFNTQTPGTFLSSKPILGLQPGETILGLDVQPTTGVLFGLGSKSRLYTIDPGTGVATAVQDRFVVFPLSLGASTIPNGMPFSPALDGTAFAFNFDPTGGSIRVLSNTGQNLVISPFFGSATAVDGPLAYGPGDPNFGQIPGVGGAAYVNSIGANASTTLYVIDSTHDVLAIQNSANGGGLATVGPLGIDVSAVVGFDIRSISGQNFGYATLAVGGTTSLYRINLTTGAATLIAPVGVPVSALAIAPEGFSSTIVMSVEGPVATLTSSDSNDTLVIDQTGGLLRHNQYDLGVAGYNSPFDFDTSLPGDQTLSSTDRSVSVIINGGGGNDKINLGSLSTPLSSLATSFTINLEDGVSNQLTLDDRADNFGRNIGIGPVLASGSGTTSLITGLGAPLRFIKKGYTPTTLHINGGLGNDLFQIAESYGLSAFRTVLDGGGGFDTLAADAQGASVQTRLTGLTFLPFQTYSVLLDYANIEQVNVVNARGRGIYSLSPPQVAVSALAGTEFTNQIVAQFKDFILGAKAADYQVTIQWGDGTSSPGLVVQDTTDPTHFSVYGSHRYSASGRFTVTSTIVDTGGSSTISGQPRGIFYDDMPRPVFDAASTSVAWPPVTVTTTYLPEDPVSTTTQILVLDPPIAVAGRLDSASDTGASNQDGITNDNTPTFTGTSSPGALIQIFNGTDPATRQPIASAVADAHGNWQATVLNPLADGLYQSLVVEAVSANGRSHATSSLASLTIDTVAPTVTNLEFRRINGQINITFQDDRSGLNQAGITNQANYVLAGIGPVAVRNQRLPITRATTTPQGNPTHAQVVNLAINNGRRLRAGRYTFTANASGITDLAGNALNGEFTGRFPSGNAQPGGNFVAGLRPIRRIVAVSDGTGAATQAGHRQAALKKNAGNAHPAGPNQQVAHLENRPHTAASFKAQGRKVGR